MGEVWWSANERLMVTSEAGFKLLVDAHSRDKRVEWMRYSR